MCFFLSNREIPTTKIARMLTGPEVRGCRPVLVHFANWKDREEILSKSKLLRGSNIYVTEDISRKIREHRNELNKFMREVFFFITKSYPFKTRANLQKPHFFKEVGETL